MSLVPFLLNEMLEDYRRPPSMRDLIDQHFGVGLRDAFHHPDHVAHHHTPIRSGYIRPWRHVPHHESGVSSLVNDKHEFKVNLDVQQFKPDELNVKVEKGYLVVDGKHEERSDDHGFISRQFTRKYKIPEDVDPNAIVSKLSSDGVLSLQAPKVIQHEEGKSRVLPITQTNEPLRIKPAEKKDGKPVEGATMETN